MVVVKVARVNVFREMEYYFWYHSLRFDCVIVPVNGDRSEQVPTQSPIRRVWYGWSGTLFAGEV